jgi:serpin B
MRQTNRFEYAENSFGQMLLLPYEDSSMAMLLVLPQKELGWATGRASVDLSQLESYVAALRPTRLRVVIPKFSFNTRMSLREHLEADMPTPFSHKADFTGICSTEDLKLSDVAHQAFVDVDEAGTEAGAASAAVIVQKSEVPDLQFVADHPFVFALLDRANGAIWFAGQVCQP